MVLLIRMRIVLVLMETVMVPVGLYWSFKKKKNTKSYG